jgi:hypothetical protein
MPGFGCPICLERFDSASQRDDHIRERKCDPREQAAPEFVDGASLDRLKDRANRKLSPVEQWQALWEILFPGTPKPASPYLGSQIEDFVDNQYDFWKQRGQQIVDDVLRDLGQTASNNQQLSGPLFDLLDKVQVQLLRRFCDTYNGPYHFDNYVTTHRQFSLPLEESHQPLTSVPGLGTFPVQPVSVMSDATLPPPSSIPASWDDFSSDLSMFAAPTKLDETQHSSTEHTGLDSVTLLSNIESTGGNYQLGTTWGDPPTAQRSGLIDSPLGLPPLSWDPLIQVAISQA